MTYFEFELGIDPSLLTVRNRLGCSPLDSISDYSLRDQISNRQNASSNITNPMYLPVMGEKHIPPMLEMLSSSIYTHPMEEEGIQSLVLSESSLSNEPSLSL